MNEELLIGILQHFKKATEKHPDFHYKIMTGSMVSVNSMLAKLRKVNDEGRKSTIMTILYEEIMEFKEAYLAGDTEHAMDEILDSIAVLCRLYMRLHESISIKKDGEK